MKKTIFQKASVFIFGMLMCTWMIAQNTISGTISDASGEPLIGANILVKGTTDGTITDFDGTYSLSTAESFPMTVVVSFTGYNSQEIDLADGSSSLDVVLQEGVLLGADVIVSASRRREKIQEAPASVSVLTARKLEATPNDQVARAVINEPGVYVQQQGAGRVNIQLRGDGGIFGSASFPILDYRSLSGPGLGTFDNLNSPLSNLDIERVEVVRGPGSALYGPGVTSGVVHFISKSAIDNPGTSLELMGGEMSTYGISARHATKVSDKFGFKINAVVKRGGEFTYDPNDPVDADILARSLPQQIDPSTGQPLTRGVYAPAITGGIVDATQPPRLLVALDDLDGHSTEVPQQDFWRQFILNGTLEFRPQDDLSVVVSGGTNNASAPFYNSQGPGLSQATEYWTQARLQKGGFFAQAFWLYNDGGPDDNPTFLYQTASSTRVERTQFEAQAQYNFDTPSFLDANWTAGFDYRLSVANTFNQVYGREEDDDDFGIAGGYLQGKFALGNKLDLVLAGRYDQFNFLDEGAFSPRAVFVFKPSPKHTFRAGYNRAVGAPTQLQVNIDFPVSTVVPGAFDIWLRGNKGPQTFGDNPQIVFNGAVPFPSLPVGTPGLPLGFIQGAVSAQVIPALAQGLVAANPLFAPLVEPITAFLSDPANFASGFGGQFAGINLFNGQPLGLLDTPSAKLRVEDTWEVGYKGLFADKFGLSVDLYNRKIDGSTLFTAISPGYGLLGTEGIPDQLASGVAGNFSPFLSGLLAPFVGTAIPDQATADAIVAQVSGLVGGAYGQGAAGFLQAIAPLNAGFALATTPTQQVPDNGVTHLAAGYRTFEEFDYWGMDVGANYFVNNDLSLFANYSWTSDNEFTPKIQDVDGTALTAIGQPTNRWRAGLNYTPEYGLRANVSFQHDPSFQVYLGQFAGLTDEKNLVDAGVGYKFENGLSLNVSAQNLFNNEYRTYPNFPVIGRRMLGTLRYDFGGGDGGSSSSGMSMDKSKSKMDSDGDGVKDSKDLCPDVAGERKFKGCPMEYNEYMAMLKAEEEARMKAEAEAKAKAEAEAKARAEAEAKAAAEAAAKAKAEAEARAAAEAAAAAKAEEERKMAEAKAAAARAEALRVRNAEITTRFTAALQGLQFNSARSTFKQASLAKMDEAVSIMNQYGDIRVLIQGHTDSQGAEDANMKLSQSRADAVKEYLVSKGIAASRLSTNGLGETQPIADNKTAEGRAMNRRVEFIILR